MEMKAVTLWQPWASAVALGLKRFETRSWATAYRGPILIHAAARWTMEEVRFQAHGVHFLRACLGVSDPRMLGFEKNPPRGCVVAVADLAECWPAESVAASELERFFGDFRIGRWAWRLDSGAIHSRHGGGGGSGGINSVNPAAPVAPVPLSGGTAGWAAGRQGRGMA
jgi:hypothetical protein